MLNLLDYLIHDAVINSFLGIHPIIPVEILKDLFRGLAAVFSQDPGAKVLHSFGLPGLYFEVSAYPPDRSADRRLMDHYFATWINKSFSLFTTTQQNTAHGSSK